MRAALITTLLAALSGGCLDCSRLDEAACRAEPACRTVVATPCEAGGEPRLFECVDETSAQCGMDQPLIHPKTLECLVLACE